MKNARKLVGHAFVVLVIEKTNETFGRLTFRWCPRCGRVLESFRPRQGELPVYMTTDARGSSSRQSPPVCRRSRCSWGEPS